MADFPIVEGTELENTGAVASTRGTPIVAGSPAHTKGGWGGGLLLDGLAPIAMAGDGFHLLVTLGGYVLTDPGADFLVDIGAGTVDDEPDVPLFENLYFGAGSGGRGFVTMYHVPVQVPQAFALWARCQSNVAGSYVSVMAGAQTGGFLASLPLGAMGLPGVNLGTTRGIEVDPGGFANLPGAWSEIVAATDSPINALIPVIGNRQRSARASELDWLVDIGVGTAGSEVPIIDELWFSSVTELGLLTPQVMPPIYVSIPAGSRLSARARCSATPTPERLFDVFLYALN